MSYKPVDNQVSTLSKGDKALASQANVISWAEEAYGIAAISKMVRKGRTIFGIIQIQRFFFIFLVSLIFAGDLQIYEKRCIHTATLPYPALSTGQWLCGSPFQVICLFRAKDRGSLRNNLAFLHLSFRPSLATAQSQSPRNSSLFLWLYSIAATKPDPNLSVNSAKLFLCEP